MSRHRFFLLPTLSTLTSLLLMFFSQPTQAQTTLPRVIHETEGPFYGTWVFNNGQYSAGWSNGAAAVMTVASFTPQSVVLYRTDTSGSVSRGMTAVYTGQISSTGESIQNGSVTWTWPGVPGYPATGHWNASWETARIFLEDKDVTGTTPSVVVGQKVNLKVKLSSDATCSLPRWSVEGMTVAGFEALPSFYNPLGGSAVPTDFTESSATESFYWVKGGAFLVTASCMLGNQELSAQVTFNVDMPDVPAVSTKLGKINVRQDSTGKWLLQLGGTLANPGIIFQTKPASTGIYQWIQTIAGLQIVYHAPGGRTTTTTASNALDTYYPYNNNAKPNNFLLNDNPGTTLVSPYTAATEVMSARMYLMWNPRLPSNCVLPSTESGAGTCTSISVPLGYVDWQWSAAARYISHKQWELVPGSTSKWAKPFVHSSSFPSWLQRLISGCYPNCGRQHQTSFWYEPFQANE